MAADERLNRQRILVVEDEDKLRRVLELQLRSSGFDVTLAADASEGLRLVAEADLVLTDLRLPGMDGLGLLQSLREASIAVPVVVMTAYGTVESAVEAMKSGAADFLLKPFSLDHLTTVIGKALQVRALEDENRRLRAEVSQRRELAGVLGQSPSMRDIFSTIERVAPSRATILICGESGTGKDRLARAIHQLSPRSRMPFVKINCTALPENLMESELFGFEKGAFTGAIAAKPGRFEQADGGTVFLDEIGDVPPSVQVKLLRVLQDRELERLGSNRTRAVDVRVVAATNVDLRAALEQGSFREDLYYRLNVVPINVPALRDRKEDLPALARLFAGDVAITDAAMEKLLTWRWPGNVRELENVVERSLLLRRGNALEASDIKIDENSLHKPEALRFLPDGMTLDQYENQLVQEALRRANGNKSQAARLLGITRNALRYRLGQTDGEGSKNGED